MMAAPFMKTVSVTSAPAAATETRMIMDTTVYVRGANAASVTAAFDGGGSAELFPGMIVAFGPIDISKLRFSGSVGDKVTVVGIAR